MLHGRYMLMFLKFLTKKANAEMYQAKRMEIKERQN